MIQYLKQKLSRPNTAWSCPAPTFQQAVRGAEDHAGAVAALLPPRHMLLALVEQQGVRIPDDLDMSDAVFFKVLQARPEDKKAVRLGHKRVDRHLAVVVVMKRTWSQGLQASLQVLDGVPVHLDLCHFLRVDSLENLFAWSHAVGGAIAGLSKDCLG
eukprot:3950328-Pyramimonas_sp.AAC.1